MIWWRFKNHLEARFGVGDEQLEDCPERITRLSFERWQVLYNGDPEGWKVCENSNSFGKPKYRLPVYHMKKYRNEAYQQVELRYVKFLSSDDYSKYNAFIDNLYARGEDYQNLKEIEELTSHIGKIAEKRLREIQQRTQKAINENQKLMEEVRLKIQGEGDKACELSF